MCLGSGIIADANELLTDPLFSLDLLKQQGISVNYKKDIRAPIWRPIKQVVIPQSNVYHKPLSANQKIELYQFDKMKKDDQDLEKLSSGGWLFMVNRTTKPDVVEQVQKTVAETAWCLRQQFKTTFNLPSQFFKVTKYAQNKQSIALINPFTHKQGIIMDIVEIPNGHAQINLYANGSTVSEMWKMLPEKCR